MIDFIKRGQERMAFALKQQKGKLGCVYVVLGASGLYKIGRTADLNKRLLELGRQFGSLTLECQIKSVNPVRAEIELHERFAAKRIDGEWFALSSEDIAEIKSIESL